MWFDVPDVLTITEVSAIEHIFPEGQNITDPWINMIANGDIELAKQYLSEYAHTLGNLTMMRTAYKVGFKDGANLMKGLRD